MPSEISGKRNIHTGRTCPTHADTRIVASWIIMTGCRKMHVRTFYFCDPCRQVFRSIAKNMETHLACSPDCQEPILAWEEHQIA